MVSVMFLCEGLSLVTQQQCVSVVCVDTGLPLVSAAAPGTNLAITRLVPGRRTTENIGHRCHHQPHGTQGRGKTYCDLFLMFCGSRK